MIPITRLLIVLSGLTLAPLWAQAQAATELMREGNELFRAELYGAALRRYQEAEAAGLDSPLLHYNLGVARYRLGQYAAALPEFEQASEGDALAALAHYNLALCYRALGEDPAARRWFERVVVESDRRNLRDLASAALAAAGAERGVATSARAAATPRVGDLTVIVLARYGQDDNVYRTPAEPYVDLAQPNQPLVTPAVQSAPYLPLDALVRYTLHNEAGDTDFVWSYRLDGNFYQGDFSNANEVRQRLEMGADIVLAEEGTRRRALDSAFFVLDNEETNFDPDDGINRDIGGVDISRRFAYRGAGIRGGYEQRIDDWAWGADARFERRQYRRTQLVDSYDHDLYFARGWAEYRFSEQMKLSLSGRQYRRVYDQRVARDLNGALLSTSPALLLRYEGLQIGVERELTSALTLGFDYQRLRRTDAFVGYDDYTRDIFRLSADYRPTVRTRVYARVFTGGYDYPRAFAFNTPTGGPRDLDRLDGFVRLEYRLRRNLWLWGEVEIDDVSSTDTRADYSRTRTALGAMWRR